MIQTAFALGRLETEKSEKSEFEFAFSFQLNNVPLSRKSI